LFWLAARGGEPSVHVARFRPNLLLDVTGDHSTERAEDSWVGRRIELGEALLLVRERAERCVMVSMPQSGHTIEANAAVLQVIASESDAGFGVYAEVLRPGRVRVGDAFTFR
jgi:uncharacterized protein